MAASNTATSNPNPFAGATYKASDDLEDESSRTAMVFVFCRRSAGLRVVL